MDLELSEQQRQLQDAAIRFAPSKLKTSSRSRRITSSFSSDAAIRFARSELNDDVIRRDRDEVFSFDGANRIAASCSCRCCSESSRSIRDWPQELLKT